VASYGASNAGGVTPASVTGREREGSDNGGDDRWGRLVGERERRIGAGLVRGRAGLAGSRVRPRWLLGLPLFIFFFCSPFLYF
jgi:hypothetical protein